MGAWKGRDRARILYIDAYDSFTNNIVGLLEGRLNVDVHVFRIDDERLVRDLGGTLHCYDAVVLGPGPGSPVNPDDVGVMNEIWQLENDDILPVLGICLGFQSLGHAYGANVKKLKQARHGINTNVVHRGQDIFEGLGDIQATQYHSLYVDHGHKTDDILQRAAQLWRPTAICPELQPLAWDFDDETNDPLLMAHRHVHKPFWGVQFHPESICTSPEGHRIIDAWWKHARCWLKQRHYVRPPRYSTSSRRSVRALGGRAKKIRSLTCHENGHLDRLDMPSTKAQTLHWERRDLVPSHSRALMDHLASLEGDVVLLDSQGHASGRYSIVGFVESNETTKLTYSIHNRQLRCNAPNDSAKSRHVESVEEVWDILKANHMRPDPFSASEGLPQESPFWGGWMGYVSYEAGLAGIDIEIPSTSQAGGRPDFSFAFVERSVVLNHVDGVVYLQTLKPNDSAWLKSMQDLIDHTSSRKTPSSMAHQRSRQLIEEDDQLADNLRYTAMSQPDESEYRSNVLECQSRLADGESYELCYTSETKVLTPQSVRPWSLYKRLRDRNAAPFGAYLRLSGATILSSSPERFLNWDRHGNCQLRPIKGTVKKTSDMTYEKASAILNTSKEKAENLMIVDLIRHDLSGVIGASNCNVTKLMQVEEYQTVFQLVSVIEGRIPRQMPIKLPTRGSKLNARNTRPPVKANARQIQGLDVLKASLPPGSMTGAPKKRSCEILARLEERPRGIYSGVLGYLDVGGGGDFSVVIRTAFSYDDEIEEAPLQHSDGSTFTSPERLAHRVWRVGAGGAVTVQSDDKAEFDEMETKLDSVLGIFRP